MPYINLVQEQRLVKQANERKSRSFFLMFVGVIAASGVAYGFLAMESIIVGRQIANIQAQNKKNEPVLKEIDANTKALGQINPRLKTLTDAQEITDKWNRVLNHLAVQTPSSVWLSGIRCSSSDATKPIQVSFLGASTSQSPIGEFILRLQNLPDLESVTLGHTGEKMISTSRAIEFQIDANLAGTAQQKAKEKEESQ